MLGAEEAAKIGLVDDVVAPELVFDKSVEVALKFAALPRDARHKSKVRVDAGTGTATLCFGVF
jgi:enoyl-CoA hydratase/carnithine racemase